MLTSRTGTSAHAINAATQAVVAVSRLRRRFTQTPGTTSGLDNVVPPLTAVMLICSEVVMVDIKCAAPLRAKLLLGQVCSRPQIEVAATDVVGRFRVSRH